MDENQLIEERGVESKNSISPLFITILLFPIGTFIGFSLFLFLFIKKRWRVSMISLVSLFISLLTVMAYFILKPLLFFSDFSINNFLYFYSFLNFFIVNIFLFGYSFWAASKIKYNPELLSTKGVLEDFEYDRTFWEKIKIEKLKKSCREGKEFSKKGTPLGVVTTKINLGDGTFYDKPHIVRKYYEEGFTHCLITGASGSGKSKGLFNQVYNDIKSNIPVVFVDCKGALDTVYYLSKWAKENNRPFYHFVGGKKEAYHNIYNDKKAYWDPLANGDLDEQVETVLKLRTWSEEHYKQGAKTVISSILFILNNANHDSVHNFPWNKGKLFQIVAALEGENLFKLYNSALNNLNKIGTEEDRDKLIAANTLCLALSGKKDESGLRNHAMTFKGILNNILLSDLGTYLGRGEKNINLKNICYSKEGPVVLFSLPQKADDITRAVGNMIVEEIKRIASKKSEEQNKNIVSFYIDEWQKVDVYSVMTILEQARSAKIGATLAFQSINQLPDEKTISSILDTINLFIVYAGSKGDSGQYFTDTVGYYNKKVFKSIVSSNISKWSYYFGWMKNANKVMPIIEETPILSKQDLQSLAIPKKGNNYKSEAYYITKSCYEKGFEGENRNITRRVEIILSPEILEDVPQSFVEEYNRGLTRNEKSKIYPSKVFVEDSISDNNFSLEEIHKNTEAKKIIEETSPVEDVVHFKKIELSENSIYKNIYKKENKNDIHNKENKNNFSLPDLD